MKTTLTRLFIVSLAALVVSSPSALAQRQLGKKKGPTSKIYVAGSTGDTQIQTGDKIYTARQATAFDAPGTIIETKQGASNTLVFSNGTGLSIAENTRVEINRFVQEPFKPQRNANVDTLAEPSISQSNVFVSRGAVGICTSQMVSGSSMNYGTPEGSVNIRGGKVSIETNADETIVDLLDGDITVRGGGKDVGGQMLRAGERAIIHPGPAGHPPSVTISPIPPERLQALDERVTNACNAKKTVTFEVIAQKAALGLDTPPAETAAAGGTKKNQEGNAASGDTPAADATQGTFSSDDSNQEIVAKPTVPEQLPTNVVVSPDRLPGK